MKQVIDNTSNLELARNIYNHSIEVEKINTTFQYIMATQEIDTMAAQPSTSKDEPDDKPPIFKMAHNNLEEAAAYLTNVSQLVDTFMTHIKSFNCYEKLAAYQDFIFNLCKRLKELDKNYFENSSISTVLDLVRDKTCKPFVKKLPNVPDDQQIEKRQLEDNIPTGQDVLSKMVQPEGFKALDVVGKSAIVKLFSNLQSAHNSLANVASSIMDLGKVSSPHQFIYILSLVIHPLIQLKLPPELFAPGEMRFEKERLTPKETFEEQCLNIVLSHARHPKLAKVPGKHPTCCQATATHLLLHKRMFNTKVSQAAIAQEFGVENKKLHMAISGCKYDAGKKALLQKSTIW